MKQAVTTTVAVLGGLMGIAQAGYWYECLCGALASYLARRAAASLREEAEVQRAAHLTITGSRGEGRP
jgi:hypothetical protein